MTAGTKSPTPPIASKLVLGSGADLNFGKIMSNYPVLFTPRPLSSLAQFAQLARPTETFSLARASG